MRLAKCFNSSYITCLDYNISNVDNVKVFNSSFIYTKIITSINRIYYQSNNTYYVTSFHYNNIYKISRLIAIGFKEIFLSSIGTIHSECWDISTKGGCKCGYIPNVPDEKNISKAFDKVVSISHNWCNAVFHSIVECLVKLGYYIEELLLDTSIKIHTIRSPAIKYLHFLGFNNSRIIYGNVYVKRLLILEKGSCGSPPPLIHLYSIRYYLRKKIKPEKNYDIIIIKRYGIREIINHNELYNTIKMIYGEEKIVIFYPNTSFNNMLNYFKYAKIIIAPHGAGLSNIIISYNCLIVEFLTNNLCYSGLAKKLGLDYYGIYETMINGKFLINITALFMILDNII